MVADGMGACWHIGEVCGVKPGIVLRDCYALRRFLSLFVPYPRRPKEQPAWPLIDWTHDEAVFAVLLMAAVCAP